MSAASRIATGQDWANHIAHAQDSNSLLHIVAELEGRLDEKLLEKAVQATLRMEPVLASRFDEGQTPPCWTPLSIGEPRDWFQAAALDSLENAIRHFIEETSLEGGRQLLVQLIHGPESDAVCIKLDHACCDGGGAKAYLLLLCNTYNRLSNEAFLPDEAAFVPNDDFPVRSSQRVYAACGIQDIRQAYRPDKEAPVPSVTVPFLEGTSSQARFEMLRIPLSALRHRENPITVNDLLLTAITRFLAGLDQDTAGTTGVTCQPAVNLTIDLRRYLPLEQQPVVCNLSGMEKVMPSDVAPDEEFGQTVKQIHEIMSRIKKSNPGLHSAVSMDFLTKLPYPQAKGMLLQASSRMKAAGQSSPILSNLGWLAPGELYFGETAAVHVYAVTPAMHAPAFMVGASSYGNEITLTAAYFEAERTSEGIRSLLEAIGTQLTEKDCPNLTFKVN